MLSIILGLGLLSVLVGVTVLELRQRYLFRKYFGFSPPERPQFRDNLKVMGLIGEFRRVIEDKIVEQERLDCLLTHRVIITRYDAHEATQIAEGMDELTDAICFGISCYRERCRVADALGFYMVKQVFPDAFKPLEQRKVSFPRRT